MTDKQTQTAETGPSEEVKALLAQLAEAQAKIEAMGRKSMQALTIKVSEKGAVSVYGLGRFPVTLYGSQWERLIAEAPKVAAFLKANSGKLATKA